MFRSFPGGDAGRKLSLRIPSIMDHVQILMCCSCIVGFWWSWWVFSDSEKILRSWGKQGLFMTFILGDGSSIFLLPQFSEGDKSHLLSPSPIPLQQDPWKIRDKSPNKDFPLTAPQNHQIHPKAQFFSPTLKEREWAKGGFVAFEGGNLEEKKNKKKTPRVWGGGDKWLKGHAVGDKEFLPRPWGFRMQMKRVEVNQPWHLQQTQNDI